MFRLAKLLYLLAVVGLLVVLALVDQFAPALHANALRQRMRAELVALHTLFLQQLQLDRLEQAVWTDLVARDLGPAPALATTPALEDAGDAEDDADDTTGEANDEEPGAAEAETDSPVAEVAAPSLEESTESALGRVFARTHRDPLATLVLDARGLPVATMGAPDPWPRPLPGSVAMLCETDAVATAIVDGGAGVLLAACAPLVNTAGERTGSVVSAQPVEVTDFAAAHPNLEIQVALFRHDGVILSTSIDDPTLMAAAERLLGGLRADDDLPTVESPVPRVAFDQDGPVLRAFLAGSVPLDQAGPSPVGFGLLLDAGRIPPDLATLVFDNLASLKGSDRLALTVGLGFVLFLFGLVLFEFEGLRYRRAIELLEYQIARRPSVGERQPTGAAPTVGSEASPVLVTTAEPAKAGNGSADNDLRDLYAAYVEDIERQGDGAAPSSFEAFRERLAKVEADLKKRHGCRAVRFSTATVDGNVVVLATPLS